MSDAETKNSMQGNGQNVLPPVIRVFLSSTFADMERERHYFNTELVPKLRESAANRGVSFFSVDLRWGITVEDQINGQVLPICLREIDNCRPFFLGIVGNRYGSVVEEISDELKSQLPWLQGHSGKSVTELEMLYGVLETEAETADPNCAFLFRSDALSQEFYPEITESTDKLEKLSDLKKEIRQKIQDQVYDYGSLEEFGEHVLMVFQEWLVRSFPTTGSVRQARRIWYERELLRDYIPLASMEHFMDEYFSQGKRPLLICGEGQSGKTTFLNAWHPKVGKKLVVNCGSDALFSYWPEIAHEIINTLRRWNPDFSMPEYQAKSTDYYLLLQEVKAKKSGETEDSKDIYYVSDEELNSFRIGFVKWLQSQRFTEPTYVVINDLELMTYEDGYQLTWLPAELPENLYIICSTNYKMIQDYAGLLGWSTTHMQKYTVEFIEEYLARFLSNFGKNISKEQKARLLACPLLQYPGYLEIIINFLNVYGSFANLDEITEKIGSMDKITDVYAYILNYMMQDMDEEERQVAEKTFSLLAITETGLSEDECFDLISKMVPVTNLIWSKVRVLLNRFGIATQDQWNIRDKALIEVILAATEEQEMIHCTLANYFMKKLDSAREAKRLKEIRVGTEMSRSVLQHLTKAKAWDALAESLARDKILFYLTKLEWRAVRVAYMNLILYSDLDVPALIADIMEHGPKLGTNETGRIHFPSNFNEKYVALLVDLEYKQVAEAKGAEYNIHPDSELRYRKSVKYTKEMYDAYMEAIALREQHDIQGMHALVSKFIEEYKDRMTAEQCCVYYGLKADAEIRMHLYAQALKTVARYRIYALESMEYVDLLYSMRYYTACLTEDEAIEENNQYAINLILLNGDLREYMIVQIEKAKLHLKKEELEQAKEILNFVAGVWKKVGEEREMYSTLIQLAAGYKACDKLDESLEHFQNLLESLADSKLEPVKLDELRATILGNIANIWMDKKQYFEAETVLLEALEIDERIRSIYLLENALASLARVYKYTTQLAKSIEIFERLLDLLYQTRQYNKLAEFIQEYAVMLHVGNFHKLREEMLEKWRGIFANIPNGQEILEGVYEDNRDDVGVEKLEQQALVAKGEQDWEKRGDLLYEISKKYKDTDLKKANEYVLEAGLEYEKAGLHDDMMQMLHICMWQEMKRCDYKTAEVAEQVWPYLPEEEKEAYNVWYELGKMKKIYDKTWMFFIDDEEFTKKLQQAIAITGIDSDVYLLSMTHFALAISRYTKEDVLLSIFETELKNNTESRLPKQFAKAITSMLQPHTTQLTQDYVSKTADGMLKYYEKCVKLMVMFENIEAGAIAGNIAIIFRRRKEQDKTYYYHEIAYEIYKKHEKVKDSVIEKMNLAYAHREFDDLDTSIDILRETMGELDPNKSEELYYYVVDNLAGNLAMKKDKLTDAECREIEDCSRKSEVYFRKCNEARELMICLLNQMMIHLDVHCFGREEMLQKMVEVKALRERYRIDEFDKVIAGLDEKLNEHEV